MIACMSILTASFAFNEVDPLALLVMPTIAYFAASKIPLGVLAAFNKLRKALCSQDVPFGSRARR